MGDHISRAELSAGERSLRSRIAQLASGGRFLHGSLSERTAKCGKPTCRCAKGEGHRSLYLVQSQAGKVRQICVPRRGRTRSGRRSACTRRFGVCWTKFPRWSGNVFSQGSADILRRLIAYAEKVFGFSGAVVAGVVDRRLQPRIPTSVVFKSVIVLFWARMGSLNALELTARSRFFQRWLGQSVCSADTIGRVHAPMDAEGLRQGIHHIYDRLKRNKALPDHGGIGVAALDGHESHTSYLQHCAGCLERTSQGKDGKADRIQFYHRQVTLMLLRWLPSFEAFTANSGIHRYLPPGTAANPYVCCWMLSRSEPEKTR